MSFDTPQMYRWKDPALPPQAPALQIYFLQEPQVNADVTTETGVQTYDSVLIAVIAPIGMPKSNVHREIERVLPDGKVKVNSEYAAKYAEAVKLYKAGVGSEATGTPLRDLIGMTPATIMNLKTRGVHTVEMLADMPDGAGSELMGFWEFREKAKKHLELREKNAPMVRMEAIEEKHKAEVDNLKQQLADLTALVNKRGPGRPRKDEQQQEEAA